jgi:Signal transduction histidine kinase regulating C4-dicarboxylate transport system
MEQLQNTMEPDFPSWLGVWDRIPVKALLISLDYRIFWANLQARKEYEQAGILYEGKPCYELLHHPVSPCRDCPLSTIGINRKWVSLLHDHPAPDGQLRVSQINFLPVFSESGECEFVIHLERDITDEKRIQDQLIQAEKLAGISLLASGVAHEINNPLSGILGLAEILQRTDDPILRDQYLKEIVVYSNRVADIVKDLSIYPRIFRSDALSSVNLNQALQDALRLVLRAVRFEDQMKVIEDLKEMETIQAVVEEILQIFVNLISNAVEAMEGKGILRLTSRTTTRGLEVIIQDTGPGIPKEDRKKIFDPFFTTKSPGRGTGLGLNVVHRLITKYHGSIEVESQEGRGATFRVIFPIPGREE